MTTPILDQLRTETREAHTRLEACVEIGARLADPASYRELLELFLGFYEPLEDRLAAVEGWSRWEIDLASRQKSGWLESDLLTLGLSQGEIETLPRCGSLPAVSTLSRAFGCAYVLEGSTLGGRQISGMLQESPIPVVARRFFKSYGEQVGTRWKEFVEALGHFASGEGRAEEIVAAARETFQRMEAWVCCSKTITA